MQRHFCLTEGAPGILKALLFLAVLSIPLQAHQPHDPILVLATSPNFEQDHTLLVATDYLTVSIGVYLPLISTDGGNTLTPLRGIPNRPMNSIQFSPNYAHDGTILMGGAAGLFGSTDSANTWSQLSLGNGAVVESVAFSPNYASDGTVYAITTNKVFKSTNRAVSFARVGAPAPLTGRLAVIAISPNFPVDHTLAVGGTTDGIFRSTDGGKTFTNQTQSQALAQVKALVFSPGFSTDLTIFAGTYGAGVFISTDGGTTFNASNTGIADMNVTSLITYPDYATSGTLLITTALQGVFVSSTGGSSWTPGAKAYRTLSPQNAMHYRTLAAARTSGTTVITFMGMYEGLWTSSDEANTWSYIDMLPTYLLRELRVSPTFPVDQTLLATSYGGGQLYSATGGNTWAILNTGASNAYPDANAFSPNYDNDQTVAVGVVNGMELSTNAGQSFHLVPGLNASTYVRAIAFSPNFVNDNTVLIGTDNRGTGNPQNVTYQSQSYSNQGLFLSQDGGLDWIPTSLSGTAIQNIALSPAFATDGTAFAASTVSGLYLSSNGGANWAQVFDLATDPGILQILLSPSFPTDHTAFAATPHSGIYKSVDGGMTWNPLPNSLPFTGISFAISPNFQTDQKLFVGTFQSGLLESNDGGNTFQSTGLTQNFVTALAISSGFATDQTIYAATYRGVFKSTDAGISWTFSNEPNRQENDREVNILFSGTWKRASNASASVSSLDTTSVGGSTVTAYFFGTGFSWLALMNPKGGTATVTVDGAPAGSASFEAPQSVYQAPVFQDSNLPCGPHTVVFTASSTQPAINFDAIDATRAGCGY